MNSLKKIITVAAIAFASTSASAGEVSAGGISWDATGPENGLLASFQFQQWFSNVAYGTGSEGQSIIESGATSGEVGVGSLTGVGEFNGFYQSRIFDANFSTRTCDTCELTYAFGGLVVESVAGDVTTFNTDNAWLNVYIDNQHNLFDLWAAGFTSSPKQYIGTAGNFGADSSTLDNAHTQFAEAQDGLLWASFEFDSFEVVDSLLGKFSNAELSVVGGMADVIAALDYQEGLSDLTMTASAEFDGDYSRVSNGQAANVVPEPTSIALFGLALFGLAGAARRKAK